MVQKRTVYLRVSSPRYSFPLLPSYKWLVLLHLRRIALALGLHPPSAAEDSMILTAEHPVTNLYLVEVSGWDDHKAFFVENSELEWTEESGKQVTLNRGLNEDAVIFLRLLQQTGNDRSHPVAYQANLVARNAEGQWQFSLKAVSARSQKQQLPIDLRN